jgi:hypothetical protein
VPNNGTATKAYSATQWRSKISNFQELLVVLADRHGDPGCDARLAAVHRTRIKARD